MAKPNQGIKITIVLILAFIALVLGLLTFQRYRLSPATALTNIKATMIIPARPINEFKLTFGKQQSFSNANLQGHWSFMFFGYTRCPDICPTTLSVLSNAYGILQKQKVALPQVFFISVDPERDDAAHLVPYVHYFNPAFIGVTGTPKQITALTKDVGIAYLKVTPQGQAYTGQTPTYLVDHSGAILLFNPAGKLSAVFQMPHEGQELAREYAIIVANGASN